MGASASARCRATAAVTCSAASSTDTRRPSSRATEVTPRPLMPQGTICREIRQVGINVERETVRRHPAGRLNANRGDFLAVYPDAGQPGNDLAAQPPRGERVRHDGFQRADVGVEVALAAAQINDWIAHQLARTVIRHVPAAINLNHVSAQGRILPRRAE